MDYSYAALIYKIVSLLVGLAFAYMGYRLFMSNVWGKAGELDAQFGKNKILLKKAAPGTFFVLFGALVIALTIWRGMTLEKHVKSEQPNKSNISSQWEIHEEAATSPGPVYNRDIHEKMVTSPGTVKDKK